MSTTTAYGYCTTASQSYAYGNTWTLGTIESSTTANASCWIAGTHPYNKYTPKLLLSIPSWAASVPDNSEFVSMDIKTKAYVRDDDGPHLWFDMSSYQGGAAKVDFDHYTTSSSEVTHSGDAEFWGFTGTGFDIIDQIKSGAIKIRFYAYNYGSDNTFYVDTFHIRITYREPDMKRASVIAVIP